MDFDPTWAEKDFYGLLGVEKDADEATLKKAYRKLAQKYHPDRNPDDPSAEAKFKEIGEAYDALKSQDKRRAYDAARSPRTVGAGQNMGHVFNNMDFGPGFDADFLNNLFSEATFASPGAGPLRTRGADITVDVELTFDQAVSGSVVTFNTSAGKKKFKLPALVTDGTTLRLKGGGHESINGGEPGDLLAKVSVRPHKIFTLEKSGNMSSTQIVPFDVLALGGTIEVSTYDLGPTRIKVPAGTKSGRRFKVAGKGAADSSGKRGDLFVKFEVEIPKNLSPEAKEALEAYRRAVARDGEKQSVV